MDTNINPEAVCGLLVLAGAATTSVKARNALLNYIEAGEADAALAALGTDAEEFLADTDRVSAALISAFKAR